MSHPTQTMGGLGNEIQQGPTLKQFVFVWALKSDFHSISASQAEECKNIKKSKWRENKENKRRHFSVNTRPVLKDE